MTKDFSASKLLLIPGVLACLLAFVAPGHSQDKTTPAPRHDKVLFLGNSITLHGPAEHIGWSGNWGMAASSQEKDYVHLLLGKIAVCSHIKPASMVANIAEFERKHDTYDIPLGLKAELAFKPNLVIVAIGENVPGLTTDDSKAKYRVAFARLLDELKRHGQPTIIVRSCFWGDPAKDEIMRTAAQAAGATWVDISALGKVEANSARSERTIKHAGVAGHPGDRGMQAIADALWIGIEKAGR